MAGPYLQQSHHPPAVADGHVGAQLHQHVPAPQGIRPPSHEMLVGNKVRTCTYSHMGCIADADAAATDVDGGGALQPPMPVLGGAISLGTG